MTDEWTDSQLDGRTESNYTLDATGHVLLLVNWFVFNCSWFHFNGLLGGVFILFV